MSVEHHCGAFDWLRFSAALENHQNVELDVCDLLWDCLLGSCDAGGPIAYGLDTEVYFNFREQLSTTDRNGADALLGTLLPGYINDNEQKDPSFPQNLKSLDLAVEDLPFPDGGTVTVILNPESVRNLEASCCGINLDEIGNVASSVIGSDWGDYCDRFSSAGHFLDYVREWRKLVSIAFEKQAGLFVYAA